MYAKIISLDVEEYGEVVDDDILSLYFYPEENRFYTSEGYPMMVPWRYIPFWVWERLVYTDIDYICVETSEGDLVEMFYPKLEGDEYNYFGTERS